MESFKKLLDMVFLVTMILYTFFFYHVFGQIGASGCSTVR